MFLCSKQLQKHETIAALAAFVDKTKVFFFPYTILCLLSLRTKIPLTVWKSNATFSFLSFKSQKPLF